MDVMGKAAAYGTKPPCRLRQITSAMWGLADQTHKIGGHDGISG